jgi:uncharacterized protein YacL (UPF0231 family)
MVAESYKPHSKNMSLEIAFWFLKQLRAVVSASSTMGTAVIDLWMQQQKEVYDNVSQLGNSCQGL